MQCFASGGRKMIPAKTLPPEKKLLDKYFRRGDMMIGVTGLCSVVIGAIVAYASDRHPAHIEVLETLAGLLVLGGFAAAGYALSSFVIV
jgi:hypothetical protein